MFRRKARILHLWVTRGWFVDAISRFRGEVSFPQQRFYVEAARVHRESSIRLPRPVYRRPVTVELYPIPIRISQIEGLTDSVIARSIQRNPGLHHAAQRSPERGSAGI